MLRVPDRHETSESTSDCRSTSATNIIVYANARYHSAGCSSSAYGSADAAQLAKSEILWQVLWFMLQQLTGMRQIVSITKFWSATHAVFYLEGVPKLHAGNICM